MKFLSVFSLLFFLSACIPYTMQRDQMRLGMESVIKQAARQGQLSVEFHNFEDADMRSHTIMAMQGHHYGPALTLVEEPARPKGGRVVMVLDPVVTLHGDDICSVPKGGFDKAQAETTKVAAAICYNDLSYGYIRAISREGVLEKGSPAFDLFYRHIIGLLTNPAYERMEWRSNCSDRLC